MLHDIDSGLLADGQRDGLTTAEAADRRERHGANDILPPIPSGVWRLLAASPVGSDAVVTGGQRWALRPGGRTQRGCRVAGSDRAAVRH
ncbi:cation-transporting P-type ATPase [Pseudoxanthomonas mexicana]